MLFILLMRIVFFLLGKICCFCHKTHLNEGHSVRVTDELGFSGSSRGAVWDERLYKFFILLFLLKLKLQIMSEGKTMKFPLKNIPYVHVTLFSSISTY